MKIFINDLNQSENSNYLSFSKDCFSSTVPDTNCYICDNKYETYIKEGFHFLKGQLNERILLFQETRKTNFLRPNKHKYYPIFSSYINRGNTIFKNENEFYPILDDYARSFQPELIEMGFGEKLFDICTICWNDKSEFIKEKKMIKKESLFSKKIYINELDIKKIISDKHIWKNKIISLEK